MMPISTARSSELQWTTTQRKLTLTQNGEIVGTLHRPSVWKSRFCAESASGQWVLERRGFSGGSDIVDASSGATVARFAPKWCGGTLTFSNGETFEFRSKGFWRPVLTISSMRGVPVMRIDVRKKRVELVDNGGLPATVRELLAFFSWYRIQQENDEAVAVAAVSAVVAAG